MWGVGGHWRVEEKDMAVFLLWIFGRSGWAGSGWVSVLGLGGGVLGVEVLGHGW